MAEKRFSTQLGTMESPELSADYESAKKFDKLRVGKLGVYFRDGLRLRYVSYSDADRVFIREREVNGKLCCGSTSFSYFSMVFRRDGKEFADVLSEDEKAMKQALEEIKLMAPGLATGYEPV